MSDEHSLADAMFGGSMKSSDPPPAQGETTSASFVASAISGIPMAGEKPAQPPKEEPKSGAPVDSQSTAIYGENMEGSVLEDYAPVISPILENEAFKARYDGNHEEALTIGTAGRELNAAFVDYEIGGNLAKDIMNEAGEFLTNARSEEQILGMEDASMVFLTVKYGADLNKNLAGAQRVVAEIGKRVPNFIHVLERSGLGNSPKVIEACIQSARKKGYIR
jgi:hypothetical protein